MLAIIWAFLLALPRGLLGACLWCIGKCMCWSGATLSWLVKGADKHERQ
jgi:hypothetical protein